MKKLNLLYLSQKDVVDLNLTMADAIAIVEDVLSDHGQKAFENPPKPGIHPLKDAFIHAMPGYLPRKKAGGIKWVSGFSSNHKHVLPTIMGLIVLNDMETGQPLAVMDGGHITNLRTAAVSAVAAKYLARPDAKVLGLIGAGIQGRFHLASMMEVKPEIEVARVYDTSAPALEKLLITMQPRVPFKIEACRSNQQAMEDADIIVTATGQLDERIFKASWIKEGALVMPVHTRGWEKNLFTTVDKFIVDDWKQFSHVQGGEDGYYAPLPELFAELGEVVVGSKPGRENDREKIVDFNFGMAIHDVSMAQQVLLRARQANLGTMLPFIEEKPPYA